MEEELLFPVIYFNKYTFYIENCLENFQTTTKAGLKNGILDNIIVVDSRGECFKSKNAKKLHGVGFLWGYNIFLNQRIKVDFEFLKIKSLSVDEIRAKILKNINKDKAFWQSGDNYIEIENLVKTASSIKNLILELGAIINKVY